MFGGFWDQSCDFGFFEGCWEFCGVSGFLGCRVILDVGFGDFAQVLGSGSRAGLGVIWGFGL